MLGVPVVVIDLLIVGVKMRFGVVDVKVRPVIVPSMLYHPAVEALKYRFAAVS